MKEVTDPETLKKIQAARTGGGKTRKAVTDPKVIAEIEAKRKGGSVADLPSLGASLEKAARDVRGLVGDAAEYIEKSWTGEGRYDPAIAESGELGDNLEGTTLGQSARIAGAYALTPDPFAIADIAEKTLPGAKVSIDKFKNPVIEWNGNKYYINRPGASSSDAAKFVADLAQFYPAAKIASTFAGLFARMGISIPLFAGTSVTQDLAAGQLGSEQGVDIERAGMAGLGGMFGEVLAPVVLRGWRALFGNRRFYRNGRLTPEGEAAARQANLNPDDLGAAEAQVFGANLRYASDRYSQEAPSVAAGMTQAGEFNVPLSRGQRTQDPAQLNRESLALQGATTNKAQQAMRDADALQQQNLARAADDIADELNIEARMGGTRGAAEALQKRVQQAAESARKEGSDAFQAVQIADQPTFQGQSVIDMRNQMTKKFREEFSFSYDPKLQPRVANLINALQRFSPKIVKRRKTPFFLPELERFRRIMNKQIDGATGQEQTMLISLRNDFDSWMDSAIEKSMVEGDTEVINQLKRARGLWANYRQKFGVTSSGDAGGKFIQKLLDPRTTPEEVAKGLFGLTRIYPSNSSRVIAKLQEALGDQGMAEVREMGWTTIVDKAITDSVQGGSRRMSPQKFVTAFKKALKENLTALKLLYTPDELAKMRRFAGLAERAIRPTTNPSGTAAGLSTIVRDFAKQYFTVLGFTHGLGTGIATRVGLDAAGKVVGARQARQMLNPRDPRGRLPLVPAALGGGGSGAESNRPEPPIAR